MSNKQENHHVNHYHHIKKQYALSILCFKKGMGNHIITINTLLYLVKCQGNE